MPRKLLPQFCQIRRLQQNRFSTYEVIGLYTARRRSPSTLLLGFGDTNWTDVISELRLGGFQGSIDIEGWHDPVYRDEMEMTGQVRALNYLKQCRGRPFVANPAA